MIPVIAVADEIKKICPECRLGWIVFSAVPSLGDDAIRACAAKVLPPLKARLEATPLAEMPHIGDARRGFKACGADPGRRRVSSEALYRRVRQGRELYRINSVVDVNNLLSLMTGLSFGSYDLAKISGNIVLRLGRSDEAYGGIGKDEMTLEDLPLLADGTGAFGSPVSDSVRSMITLESREICTVIYSFSPRKVLEAALEEAKVLFSGLAGAKISASGIAE